MIARLESVVSKGLTDRMVEDIGMRRPWDGLMLRNARRRRVCDEVRMTGRGEADREMRGATGDPGSPAWVGDFILISRTVT